MEAETRFRRYQELQRYVNWTSADVERVQSVAPLLEPHLPALVEDFYAEIGRHPDAMKVIGGGEVQIARLKGTLLRWLRELLAGSYGIDYVARRWQVGWRHVEIGLDQVFTNVALARVRQGLMAFLDENWTGAAPELAAIRRSLHTLIDLDLAIIEDAYQNEYVARQQRAAQQQTMGRIAGSAPCMIVLLSRDHGIRYFSPFAEELTGYSASEVLGRDYFSIFVHDSVLREAIARKKSNLVADRPEHGFECPIVCKDGSQRWMVWNAQVLHDYEEEPAVLVLGQDITSLKKAQEQALQSERLAAIGQMMTGLAHESGNALARSQACLEMLAFAVENQPKALNLINRVQVAQDHLKQLYDEVRNYAAPIKLEFEVWNLQAVWRQAWENLALARQGRNVTLTEELGTLELRLRVDPFRLGQVFRNVLDNALAACSDPVEIRIVGAPGEIEGEPALRIVIRDNGPGLNAEQRQRIFDPFFTTKTKGTGLGMAIAKRIIEAHGGRLAVGGGATPPTALEEKHGAEILITLPYNKP